MGSKYKGTAEELRALNAFIKLTRATEALGSRLDARHSKGELTESQFGTLEALYHLGPMPQVEIGRKILKSSGNITLVIDNLEKSGLVQRERSKVDRRQVYVSLTDKGHSLIEAVLPEHVHSIVAEMNRLSPDEQDRLGELCKKLGVGASPEK